MSEPAKTAEEILEKLREEIRAALGYVYTMNDIVTQRNNQTISECRNILRWAGEDTAWIDAEMVAAWERRPKSYRGRQRHYDG